jgi:hypothetical protein
MSEEKFKVDSPNKLKFDLYFKDAFGLPKPIFDKLDEIKFMKLRKTDTFVCCYPKSGTGGFFFVG